MFFTPEFMYKSPGEIKFSPCKHLLAWFSQKTYFTIVKWRKFAITEKIYNSDLISDYKGKNWLYHVIPTHILVVEMCILSMLKILRVEILLSTLWKRKDERTWMLKRLQKLAMWNPSSFISNVILFAIFHAGAVQGFWINGFQFFSKPLSSTLSALMSIQITGFLLLMAKSWWVREPFTQIWQVQTNCSNQHQCSPRYVHEMMVEYLLCYFYQFFVAQKTVIFLCGKSAERNSYKSRNKSLPAAEPLSDRQALASLYFAAVAADKHAS